MSVRRRPTHPDLPKTPRLLCPTSPKLRTTRGNGPCSRRSRPGDPHVPILDRLHQPSLRNNRTTNRTSGPRPLRVPSRRSAMRSGILQRLRARLPIGRSDCNRRHPSQRVLTPSRVATSLETGRRMTPGHTLAGGLRMSLRPPHVRRSFRRDARPLGQRWMPSGLSIPDRLRDAKTHTLKASDGTRPSFL